MDEVTLDKVEKKIVEIMIGALDKDEIEETDAAFIADFVLKKTRDIESQDQLMSFLRTLSEKWRIFTPLLVSQSGEIKEKVEVDVAGGVLALAQSGKIEEAIKLAQTMTEHSAQ